MRQHGPRRGNWNAHRSKRAQSRKPALTYRDCTPERQLELLDRALQQVSNDERELVIGVYVGNSPEERRKAKRELAARFNLTGNALRIRTCRIRAKLEEEFRRLLTKDGRAAGWPAGPATRTERADDPRAK